MTAGSTISVILAVYNEADVLERVVRSVLEQRVPGYEVEVLVIDGRSTDGSAEIVRRLAAEDPRIRLLHNERRTAPHAFNLGLREASGDLVCIMGAHSVYEERYLAVCLEEMRARDAVGCSGRVITVPAEDTLSARLACRVMTHPFGVSGRSVRTQPEGYADTIPFPLFRKDALLALGGYDERLTRNQDNDMNQRLVAAGHRLYLTWKTCCYYQARRSMRELLRYAVRSGLWNAVSLRLSPSSMRLRHLIPLLFVAYLIAGALAALGWALYGPGPAWAGALVPLAALGLHLGAGTAAGLQALLRERRPEAMLLPPAILAFHLAYGWGILRGLAGGTPEPRAARSAGPAVPLSEATHHP